MIGLLTAELYRTLALRSGLIAIAASITLGMIFGRFDAAFWSLFAGIGAFGVAVMTTAQHYQHRTSLLLFLARPRRPQVLAAQCLSAALIAVVIAVVGGLLVIAGGDDREFRATLAVIPLMAIFGVACATVVRRPLWLFAASAGWVIFVEGFYGRLEGPLPFSSFLAAAAGDYAYWRIFALWTLGALLAAIAAIRRDMTGD
jgi:hypothetical protein